MKAVNNTFCILPWVHTHIKPNGDVHLCSRKSIPLDNIKNNDLNTIINSNKMNSIRKRMLEGKKVEGCEKCYHTEKISEVSLRKLSNWWFKGLLIDNEVLEWKDDVTYDGTNYNYDWVKIFKNTPVKIKWLAIHASNICNLSCRGCYSMLSSKWKKDELKMGINPHPLFNDDLDEFGIDFKNIEVITMFGGEPLIMKQNDQLMDLLHRNNNAPNTILQYYTNCTVLPNRKTFRIWRKLKKLQLFLSIDGFKEHNDYFRHGSKWETVSKNIKIFKKYASKYNVQIKTTTVINIHNVEILDLLHNWLLEIGFNQNDITYNICIYPHELNVCNLPQEYKNKIIKKYKSINLPNNVKDLVIKQLNSKPTIDVLAVSAFTHKLDEIRDQDNPLSNLKTYLDK